jgi:hypothetical protein
LSGIRTRNPSNQAAKTYAIDRGATGTATITNTSNTNTTTTTTTTTTSNNNNNNNDNGNNKLIQFIYEEKTKK